MLLPVLNVLDTPTFFVGEMTDSEGNEGRGRTWEAETAYGLSSIVNCAVGKSGGEELRMVAGSGMIESVLCRVQPFIPFCGVAPVVLFGERWPLVVCFGDASAFEIG